MKTFPLISVIIPIYNAEKYLPTCIDSVLKQTYTNLEIILVNDGSTDASSTICQQYADKDPRIKLINKSNGGVSSARNTGLCAARGEYIGFVDGDDCIGPTMYSYLYGLIVKYQTLIARCNYADMVDENLIKERTPIVSTETLFTTQEALTSLVRQLSVCLGLVHKDLFRNFRFSSAVTYGEDFQVSFFLFQRAQKIAYGPQTTYYYRLHPQSVTRCGRWNPKHLNYFKVSNEMLDYAKKHALSELYQNEFLAQMDIFSAFFRDCVMTKPLDKPSANFLQAYFRKRLFVCLRSRLRLKKKIFVSVGCINYHVAAYVYGLLFNVKNKKRDKK